MRRAHCCYLATFVLVLGCAQNNVKTVGFSGEPQDRISKIPGDYDQRETVADYSWNFPDTGFNPNDPDPDFFY